MSKGGVIGTPGNSVALQYEIRLSELAPSARHGSPSVERTAATFEMLGELIPQLGVFQRVMKRIAEELHAATYSNVYTASGRKGAGAERDQLPYFAVAQKQLKKLEDQMKKQEDEISSLKEQLYTCEADLEKANTEAEGLRHSLRDRDNKIHELSAELRSCTAECDRLKKTAVQHQRSDERLKREVDYHMHVLQNTIQSLNEDKSDLLKYKNTHENLQDALAKGKYSSVPPETRVPATQKAQLLQHISTAEALRDNLLALQNTLMDEYDEVMNMHIQNHGSAVDAVLKGQQDRFKTSITGIYNELLLLQRHMDMLTKRINQMDQMETGSNEPHRVITEHHHPHNPLVAQLQILNKYAIMIWTSADGGKSFYPLKESQICTTCGEKIVMCPHTTYPNEITVQLSGVCTHLKISAPAAHTSACSSKPSQQSQVAQTVGQPKHGGTQTKFILPIPLPDYGIIWQHHRSKFEMERSITRQLGLEKLMIMVHQFCAWFISGDSVPMTAEDSSIPTLLDSLISWVSKRYLLRKVAPIASYDFLLALSKYYLEDIELLVLVWVLCGDVDGAALRFVLLMANLIDTMNWSSASDFGAWSAIVYPSLQQEEADHIRMSYVAHSSNKQISKIAVLEFVTYLLLKGTEPRVAQMEGKVTNHPHKDVGRMTEAEFFELVDSMVPQAHYHQVQRLYLQSLATVKQREGRETTTVPIRNLAYILSYLTLQQEANTLQEKVEQLAKVTGSQPNKEAPPTPLFTMATARSMLAKR